MPPLRIRGTHPKGGSGYHTVEFDGRNITLKSEQPQQTILDTVSLLRKKGIEIMSVSHGADNLEQLFLALTGERLRE